MKQTIESSSTCLPAPQPIMPCSVPDDLRACKAEVTSSFPHRIISCSQALCDCFGLSKQEASEKSILTIFGREYTIDILLKALKDCAEVAAERNIISTPILTLNRSDGKPCSAIVICIWNSGIDGKESSCRLLFRSVKSLHRLASSYSEISHCIPYRRNSISSGEYRARYNFLTGLEIHKSRRGSPTESGDN